MEREGYRDGEIGKGQIREGGYEWTIEKHVVSQCYLQLLC